VQRWLIKVVWIEISALRHFNRAIEMVSIIFVIKIIGVCPDQRCVQQQPSNSQKESDGDVTRSFLSHSYSPLSAPIVAGSARNGMKKPVHEDSESLLRSQIHQ
jgi:hypothetical protein